MADKLKILMGFSTLVILYEIETQSHQFDRSFLVIYCAIIVLFNRDKAITRDKIARAVVIMTLILLFVKSFLVR
ncbi:hypothetical protein RyT2_28050 [Pseudolactococcus yaeyamensis]